MRSPAPGRPAPCAGDGLADPGAGHHVAMESDTRSPYRGRPVVSDTGSAPDDIDDEDDDDDDDDDEEEAEGD
jgi:hypothetical protein